MTEPRSLPPAMRALLWTLAITALALVFRVVLDHSGSYLTRIYMERYYNGYMTRLMAEEHFWYFLLPMPAIKGVWATTGFVLNYFLEISVGPHLTYLILYGASTLAFGWCCWSLSRSVLFTAIGTATLALSPFNYSVYLWNGSNNAYNLIFFLSIATGFFGRYLFHGGSIASFRAGLVALVLAAICYEIWLNWIAVLLVALVPVRLYTRRSGNAEFWARFKKITWAGLALATLFVIIRARTLAGTAIAGSEMQFVTGYPRIGLMIDDILYNLVFFFWLTISQMLPGFVGTSLGIEAPGKLDIGTLVHGYQPDLYFLVSTHFIYTWMIYAALLLPVFIYACFKILKRAVNEPSWPWLVTGCLALSLVLGSPTHTILKFVAFNAVPFYAYKVTVGIMAQTILFAFAVWRLDLAAAETNARWRTAIPYLSVGYLLLIAFTRPGWANENILEIWGDVGFFANGFYPDPWRNLLSLFGR